MKARLTFLLLGAFAGSALAQYKCTAADGKITFQQEPCFGAKAEEKMVVVPNGHPPPASGVKPAAVAPPPGATIPPAPAESVDKKMLARYDLMHQRDALAQALRQAQDDKASRGRQKMEAAAAARKQFGDDPGNATALRDALASINNRYDAMAELDDTRVRDAQAKLDAWDKAQAAPKR